MLTPPAGVLAVHRDLPADSALEARINADDYAIIAPVPPESTRRREGSAVMNRRFCRIIVSMSVAVIAGIVAGEAGAAQASAQAGAPLRTASASFPQTDPPGYCTPDEIGQVKRGPDGKMYKCVPVGSDPGSVDILT